MQNLRGNKKIYFFFSWLLKLAEISEPDVALCLLSGPKRGESSPVHHNRVSDSQNAVISMAGSPSVSLLIFTEESLAASSLPQQYQNYSAVNPWQRTWPCLAKVKHGRCTELRSIFNFARE